MANYNNIEYLEVLQGQISFFCTTKIDFPFNGIWEEVYGGGFNFIVYKKYTPNAILFIQKNQLGSLLKK